MAFAAKACAARRGERGGSRFNMLVVFVLIGLGVYSAYNYAPVAYHAYLYKDFMQELVNKAAYPPAKSNEWVTQQLREAAKEHDLPEDADIRVQNDGGQIVARVTWTRPVKLPGYVYEYNFDHTARSSGFISKQ
ncbi:MAG: hypothetical protein JOZ96_02375 [Acidobacteria bacterium]|nr:hypothetical protein [Acidobacteriota bacterium]